MARLKGSAYFSEPFAYFSAVPNRNRVRCAVALLGPGKAVGTMRPYSPVSDKALSRLSQDGETDSRKEDLFLQAFDDGHLIGSALGGPADCYNLVPMRAGMNRGGPWGNFESRVGAAQGSWLMAVACNYTKDQDPRIPRSIAAAALPLSNPGIFDEGNWGSWAWAVYHHCRACSTGADVALKLQALVMPAHPLINLDTAICAEIVQNDFDLKNLMPMDVALLRQRMAEAFMEMGGSWRIEEDVNFTSLTGLGPWQEGLDPSWSLPPPGQRKYAVLDYLWLRRGLDNLLQDVPSFPFPRDPSYTFSKPQRALVCQANLFLSEWRQQYGQVTFVADPADDPGTAGEGIIMEPQVDHMIPQHPEGISPGPALFSNAQVVSPRYNASDKRNFVWGTVVPLALQDVRRSDRKRPRSQSVPDVPVFSLGGGGGSGVL